MRRGSSSAARPTIAPTCWPSIARLTPLRVRFNAVFGSDIGHFDVPDMRDVVDEAYELREEGLMSDEDFRDFTFGNAVRLHGGMNPKFFEGTAVEAEARQILEADPS